MVSCYSTIARLTDTLKMFIKFFILLALLSLVKGAVIINIFEDGEAKAVHSLRACDAQQCDSFCRKAGFRIGKCVNNRCRCTSFAGFAVAENKADYSLPGSCNYQGCDQLCRNLGFPGGACVGDKCVCDDFNPIDKKLTEDKAEYSSLDSCNYQACDQLCRRLGFPGGACVGDRCKCDNFKPIVRKEEEHTSKVEETEDKEVVNSGMTLKDVLNAAVGYCDIIKCDDMCHRLNYAGGSCVQGSCECF